MSKSGLIVAFLGLLAGFALSFDWPWYVMALIGGPLGWFFGELDYKAGKYERGSK